MDSKTAPSSTAAAPEASFVRGGPFYRAQQVARIIGPNRWNLGRRIALVITIGWLPLLVSTALLKPDALVSKGY